MLPWDPKAFWEDFVRAYSSPAVQAQATPHVFRNYGAFADGPRPHAWGIRGGRRASAGPLVVERRDGAGGKGVVRTRETHTCTEPCGHNVRDSGVSHMATNLQHVCVQRVYMNIRIRE